jgi:tetraacyldisaccharide 4'-kinase
MLAWFERAAVMLQRHWWRRHASLLARALQPLALLYAGLASLDRARQEHGSRAAQPGVPVVVVGNLIAGGAGKTPTVIALVQALRAAGWTPGVISRGHGRRGTAPLEVQPHLSAAETGDEPLLILLRTAAPVVVARDRVLAAQMLCRQHPEVDLLVADDGLQHRRLARDLQIIVFDERGAGNGLCLPAGPLRDRVPAVLPPRTLVLYNAPEPSTALPGWTATRRLAGAASLAAWWQGAPPTLAALQALQGRPLLAVAGIAAPERFFAMLETAGLVFERLPLADHHDFRTLPWPAATADVVLTEKDAIKIEPGRVAGTRVWVAALDLRLEPGFIAALQQALPAPGSRPPPRSSP